MRIGIIVPLARPDSGDLLTWPALQAYVEYAEGVGLDSAWVFDHLYSGHGDVAPDEIHEAWSILTALAAVTMTIELGQLVTCTGFRHPGVLAKMAVTVDAISGGRLTLGLGAGWYDREYQAFGIPTDHRGTRFDEALTMIAGLLRGERVSMAGRFHRADDAVLLPPPARHIPILVAGQQPRMRRLAAQHADAWNTAWHAEPDPRFRDRVAAMRESLDAVGRSHASLRWTVGVDAEGRSTDELASGLASFAELGVDDAIVSLGTVDRADLNRLAEAARIAGLR